MKEDILENILGDKVRAKLFRLFIRNEDLVFVASELKSTLGVKQTIIQKTLRELIKDGIIIKKNITAQKKKQLKIRDSKGYGFNKKYKYREILRKLVLETLPVNKFTFVEKVSQVSQVRAIILFTKEFLVKSKSDIDILVASIEKDNRSVDIIIQAEIRKIEKETGIDLKYTIMSANELTYRMNIKDKFISDLLLNEHYVVLDKDNIF